MLTINDLLSFDWIEKQPIRFVGFPFLDAKSNAGFTVDNELKTGSLPKKDMKKKNTWYWMAFQNREQKQKKK